MRLRTTFLSLLALAALGLSTPAAAQFPSEISFLGTLPTTKDDTEVNLATSLKFDSGRGGGVALGGRFGFVGVELSAFYLRFDGMTRVNGTDVLDLGALDLVPISVVASFHPLKESIVDPWIGVGGAYVIGRDLMSDDLDTAGIGDVELKSKAALVANIGVAVKFSSKVAIVVDGRYIPLEMDSTPVNGGVTQKLELNPLLLSAGLRVSF